MPTEQLTVANFFVDDWMHFNDDQVRHVTEKEVMNAQGKRRDFLHESYATQNL